MRLGCSPVQQAPTRARTSLCGWTLCTVDAQEPLERFCGGGVGSGEVSRRRKLQPSLCSTLAAAWPTEGLGLEDAATIFVPEARRALGGGTAASRVRGGDVDRAEIQGAGELGGMFHRLTIYIRITQLGRQVITVLCRSLLGGVRACRGRASRLQFSGFHSIMFVRNPSRIHQFIVIPARSPRRP